MKYIVYLTKNIINSKIYIGVHGCENPELWDYYLGCGAYANKPSSYNACQTPLHAAILKYGPKNFKRTTLKVYDTEEEALWLESVLVDEQFIKRSNTYNITLGGGKPPKSNKPTYQYDINGNFIAEFESLYEASLKTGSYLEGIRNAIKLKRSCNEFYWSHDKVSHLDVNEYKKIDYRHKINAFNKNFELINSFNSQIEACKFFDFSQPSIANSILNGEFCHGVLFTSAETKIEEVIDRIKNRNRVCKTPVFSYDIKTGNFIKEFDSVKSACKEVGLKSQSPLIRAIKTKKTSSGFRWSYNKVNNILTENVIEVPNKPKKIAQYDIYGNLLKVWDISECRKVFPNCIRVCRGARSKSNGYIFKYYI